MRTLRTSARYRRDLRRVVRRGKDPELLRYVVDKLLAGESLEARYRAHRLSGDMAGYWECHIEFDWLLVWEDDGEVITLRRTGTHGDIFRQR